jgi:hypothetical protein
MQATTLDRQRASAQMQLTQDSELGELYVDANGTVTFRNRLAVLTRHPVEHLAGHVR